MADTFLKDLKHTFDLCIAEFDSLHSLFCKNPGSDFTRSRKISFSDTCRFLIELQSKSLPNEVMDFFGHSLLAPTVSAYIQQREKILTEGWDFLFHLLVRQSARFLPPGSLYRGYRLIACDGSDVSICRDPSDGDSFIQEGSKGYNMLHINALYDLLSHNYCDFIIQGKKKTMSGRPSIPWPTGTSKPPLFFWPTAAMKASMFLPTSSKTGINSSSA